MYIDKAVIHYNARLEVQVDEDSMVIEQDSLTEDKNQRIILLPDELWELVKLAKLLNWERFTG